MWGEDAFFRTEQGEVGGWGFDFEDIERDAGKVTGVEVGLRGCFIDESAAGAVDDQCAAVHAGEALRVENVFRFRRERNVEGDDIRAAEGFFGALREIDFERLRAGGGEEGVVGGNGHAEGLRAFGELGADAAHAEDGEALAVEFDAFKGLAIPLAGDD